MADNIAINPYGAYKDPYFLAAYQAPNANAMAQYQYNPYLQNAGAIQGAQNNPYFLAAYQSPNANAMAYQYNPYLQNAGALQGLQNNPQAVTTNQAARPEKKSKSKAGLVLGGIALTGAAILCHRKGSADLNTFKRILDGGRQYYNIAICTVKNLFNKTNNQAAIGKSHQLNPMSINAFKQKGGQLVGEEAITAGGKKFTGMLSTNSGKILKYIDGIRVAA